MYYVCNSGANSTTAEFTTTIERQRCSGLVRFIKLEENTLVLKMYKATRGVVIFSSAGVVTHDRTIGSRMVFLHTILVNFKITLKFILSIFN
jgi:hypothetical protein